MSTFISNDKFIEWLLELYSGEVNMTIREDDNGEEYNKVFAASVEREREKIKRKKIRRAETRKSLKQGLFGKGE